jgi:hypothetical protein
MLSCLVFLLLTWLETSFVFVTSTCGVGRNDNGIRKNVSPEFFFITLHLVNTILFPKNNIRASVVDRVFESLSSQTNDYNIGMYSFTFIKRKL